ncbi:hypothetical protein KKF69_03150 [Patescibacteria group bacterium]|nr:hypothetical protein [Patescibacteria group bacterium]MBU4016450.1 hypothetical protein [Patescibacteria group bacterium]
MEKIIILSKKILSSTRSIPDKKRYIEFFTAMLSVPVLITVIMINMNNLKGSSKSNVASLPPVQKEEKIYIPVTTSQDISTPTQAISITPANQACKPEIGPISISLPNEGDTIIENPASIIINHKTGEYCAVVWSYRLNNAAWSAYDDKSIALYNLPQGEIKIDLKIKSIVTGDEQILTRNFTYNGTASSITPEVSLMISPDVNNSSSSANQP